MNAAGFLVVLAHGGHREELLHLETVSHNHYVRFAHIAHIINWLYVEKVRKVVFYKTFYRCIMKEPHYNHGRSMNKQCKEHINHGSLNFFTLTIRVLARNQITSTSRTAQDAGPRDAWRGPTSSRSRSWRDL